MYRDEPAVEACKQALSERYGPIDGESEVYDFDHSRYYEREMGSDLKKQFVSFERLQPIEGLVAFKLFCQELEARWCVERRRTVNLDPAYLELAKLVVATRKNFDHRVYLGQQVYADVQLRYRDGAFLPNPWTYADYKSAPVLRFLQRVREKYHQQLSRNEWDV